MDDKIKTARPSFCKQYQGDYADEGIVEVINEAAGIGQMQLPGKRGKAGVTGHHGYKNGIRIRK